MTDYTIEVDTGTIVPVPVPATAVDITPVAGRCKLYGWSLRDASGDVTQQGEGAVVAPAGGGTIISVGPFNAGIYDVAWTVALEGPAAAADANNFQLVNGLAVVENSINLAAAGVYPQVGVRLAVAQGNNVTIRANGIGTAGVTYLAQVEAAATLIPNAVCELLDAGNILGTFAAPAGESESQWFDEPGLHVQNQIKVHMISGNVRGCLYVKYVEPHASWPSSG
jgi:hypothetical protein